MREYHRPQVTIRFRGFALRKEALTALASSLRMLSCSVDEYYPGARKRCVHEERKTRLRPPTFSIYCTLIRKSSDAYISTYLKDCPQRRVVSRQSSARLTGTLRHCNARSMAMTAQSFHDLRTWIWDARDKASGDFMAAIPTCTRLHVS